MDSLSPFLAGFLFALAQVGVAWLLGFWAARRESRIRRARRRSLLR